MWEKFSKILNFTTVNVFFFSKLLAFFLLRLKPMKMLTCTQHFYPHFNWHSVQLKHSWNHFETVKNQGPFCGIKSAAQNTTQMNWWQHTSTWSLSVLSLLIHLNMIIISHPPQNTVSLTEMWHERWPIINWEAARKSRRSRTKTHKHLIYTHADQVNKLQRWMANWLRFNCYVWVTNKQTNKTSTDRSRFAIFFSLKFQKDEKSGFFVNDCFILTTICTFQTGR